MNTTTVTGKDVLGFIDMGLDVAADMEADELEGTPGMAQELRTLVSENGLLEILGTIHDAALGAAEVNEEDEEVACVRLRVFSLHLRQAMAALK